MNIEIIKINKSRKTLWDGLQYNRSLQKQQWQTAGICWHCEYIAIILNILNPYKKYKTINTIYSNSDHNISPQAMGNFKCLC